MHSHLIAVKVSIIGMTDQRMELYGLTLNQYGLKSLNTKAVKSRCTVK